MAWLGIGMTGVIAILAGLHLAGDLVRIVARAEGPGAYGLLALALLLAVGAAVLGVAIARLAGSSPRGERLAVVVALALLVGLRLLVALAWDGVDDGELRAYDQLARGVLEGACCIADRPMGYPVVLAGAYTLLGPGQAAVEALNILFAILTGGCVLVLGRAVAGARGGALALYAYAIWPAGALMIATSLPHTAYELLVAAAAVALVASRPGWRGSAVVGAVLALGQLLRPSTPALLVAFLLARAWPGSSWRGLLRGTLLPMAAVFGLLLLPVVDANLRLHGELSISTSAFGGHSLYIGTDQRSGGTLSSQNLAEIDAMPGETTWERSAAAGAAALSRIRADPLGTALLALRKQDTLWGTERYGVQYAIRRELAARPERPDGMVPLVLAGVFWPVVAAAAALGLFLRRREVRAFEVLVVACLVAVAVSHALLEVRDRYHSYVVPLLLPLAAAGLLSLIDRLPGRAPASDA